MSGIRNPFLRENPYFVPQRFYSHQKINNYMSQVDSPSFHIYDRPINDRNYALQQQRRKDNNNNNSTIANLDDKYKKSNTLKRKNINAIENPFFRKNLVAANREINEQIPTFQHLEYKYYQLFEAVKPKEKQIVNNNYVKILSSTNILEEKQNKPKYLSSELKIKLKSQTQINDNPMSTQFISCSPKKSGLVTLGRVEGSNQNISSLRCNDISQKIVVKGKTYYLHRVS